ncbi:MAG: helix-turn-helix transcriptional regulator [Erysipelotrichaceae bacterium]|nr:helix-turn-helix transcriptional regulator [Erysipelotrichaceae bacterium]MBQ9841231.1 helix-turn-helix transcriptional regulator [Erysipelotrichaceae bacterium]
MKKQSKYFDYIKMAREEFQVLVECYPELKYLSVREMEIFEQLLSDKTLTTIADELCISHSAVHFHCKNIYKKLNITNRRQFLITYKDFVCKEG